MLRSVREVVSPSRAPSISSQMIVGITEGIEQNKHGPFDAFLTSIVITLVVELGGLSLSVAMNVTWYVPVWFLLGVHENAPVVGSRLAPDGRPEAEKVMMSLSRSDAFSVKVIGEFVSPTM